MFDKEKKKENNISIKRTLNEKDYFCIFYFIVLTCPSLVGLRLWILSDSREARPGPCQIKWRIYKSG